MIRIDKKFLDEHKYAINRFDEYGLYKGSLFVKAWTEEMRDKPIEKGEADHLIGSLSVDEWNKVIYYMGEHEEYEWCRFFQRIKERRASKSNGYWELIGFDKKDLSQKIGFTEDALMRLLNIDQG